MRRDIGLLTKLMWPAANLDQCRLVPDKRQSVYLSNALTNIHRLTGRLTCACSAISSVKKEDSILVVFELQPSHLLLGFSSGSPKREEKISSFQAVVRGGAKHVKRWTPGCSKCSVSKPQSGL